MTPREFREQHCVHQCERCCGNCKHGKDLCDDGTVECAHPDLEGNVLFNELSDVCNAWEQVAGGSI